MRILILITFLVVSSFPAISSARPRFKACLKENGSIVVRRNCRADRGQVPLDAELLQDLGASMVGPQGPEGPQGPQGPEGITGLEQFDSSFIHTFDPFADHAILVVCGSGKYVVSYACKDDNDDVTITSNTSIGNNNNSVFCEWMNNDVVAKANVNLTASVVCIDIP